jgi:predicted kinase
MPEAIIFVGIQGSGKTTFYWRQFAETHTHISLDVLRTRRSEQMEVAAQLKAERSFVVDNTNPTIQDRARYIGPAHAAGFRVVAYFFESSLADAIRRNNERAGLKKIPVAAVAATFRKLQPPALDEGFDAIYTVRINDARNTFVVTST